METSLSRGVIVEGVPQSVVQPRVVIVEDDAMVREFLENVLAGDGYTCRSFPNPGEALPYLLSSSSDLVFSDIHMPGMSGLELLRTARNAGCVTPFVMISGSYDVPLALDAISAGAVDYLLKPARVSDILALAARRVKRCGGADLGVDRAQRTLLSKEAAQKTKTELQSTGDICNLLGSLAGAPLGALLGRLSARRIETLEHSLRVASYAVLLGRSIGRSRASVDLRELQLGAVLHDIGKVGVPENVIAKAGPLNSEEWRIMKLHPEIGYELLKPIRGLVGVSQIVLGHHEAFGGAGYPARLAGEAIPFGARIFSVVDTFDAITSDRPYRSAQAFAVAREEIVRQRGFQFDPYVVDAFLALPDAELVACRESGALV